MSKLIFLEPQQITAEDFYRALAKTRREIQKMIGNASVPFKAVKMFTEAEYREAIAHLLNAMGQRQPDGNICAVCGSDEHQAWECKDNPLAAAYAYKTERAGWRCFHCGEYFTDAAAAHLHFEVDDANAPACMQTLRDDLRDFAVIMEQKLRKHDNEFHVDDYKRQTVNKLAEQLTLHVGKAMRQQTPGAWADVANFAMMLAHHHRGG